MTMQQSKVRALRVAIISPFPPPHGGMSLQAQKLSVRLAGEGIAVETVATNPALPRPLRFVQRIPAVRTLIRAVQYLWLLIRGVQKATVVHHLSASGLYFFVNSVPALVLGRCMGRPVILNYRGGKAGAFLHGWGWIIVPLMRLAHRIVVPSVFLQKIFHSHGLAASLLPNLADTDSFHYEQRSQFQPRCLVTRNLEPMYDVECVLSAFRSVQDLYPDAVLGIVGSGSEEKKLRAVAAEWKLRNVTFYGALPNESLPKIYAAHDIFVNGSRIDNFPGALVEAACCGLPIVTTRAGGIPDMLRDRETGLLVEVGDAKALAAAVIEVVEKPQLGRDLTRNARRWAEQFSWPRIFPELLSCYGAPRPMTAEPVLEESKLSV